MLLPTVASAIVMWYRIADEFDVSLDRKGINKEIGHSQMEGLDHVHDTIEKLDARCTTSTSTTKATTTASAWAVRAGSTSTSQLASMG